MTIDEEAVDPWVAAWFAVNPMVATPLEILSPEVLELARSPVGAPSTREVADVADDVVDRVPVRIYQHDASPTGLVVYFHGGGFCIGSIGLMDNVARELACASGAVVASVEYRLAPEYPFPAALDDCETVARWALGHASRFGASPRHVAVAGESAGGNLAAAVALRLRGRAEPPLAAQVLMYPVLDEPSVPYPSRSCDGIVINATTRYMFHAAYTGGRDLGRDAFVSPLHAETLAGLPPAILVLGGRDPLRDEGRAYANRLRAEGGTAEEYCYTGQPHGFVNFGFPAAAKAFEQIGRFLRLTFASIKPAE